MQKSDHRRRQTKDSTPHGEIAAGKDKAGDQGLVELARHLARIAAEHDYKTLRETGKIPYSSENPERRAP